jgi:hypothetical protein
MLSNLNNLVPPPRAKSARGHCLPVWCSTPRLCYYCTSTTHESTSRSSLDPIRDVTVTIAAPSLSHCHLVLLFMLPGHILRLATFNDMKRSRVPEFSPLDGSVTNEVPAFVLLEKMPKRLAAAHQTIELVMKKFRQVCESP